MNSNIKFLSYDLLKLIDSNIQESCTVIQKKLDEGTVVQYLLNKYEMDYLRKVNVQETINLLQMNRGVFTNEVYKEQNGLLFLLEVLLEY